VRRVRRAPYPRRSRGRRFRVGARSGRLIPTALPRGFAICSVLGHGVLIFIKAAGHAPRCSPTATPGTGGSPSRAGGPRGQLLLGARAFGMVLLGRAFFVLPPRRPERRSERRSEQPLERPLRRVVVHLVGAYLVAARSDNRRSTGPAGFQPLACGPRGPAGTRLWRPPARLPPTCGSSSPGTPLRRSWWVPRRIAAPGSPLLVLPRRVFTDSACAGNTSGARLRAIPLSKRVRSRRPENLPAKRRPLARTVGVRKRPITVLCNVS
jgi:hypothetical protein